MDLTGQSLLKLLFNEGESVCVSPNKWGYHSIPLSEALNGHIKLVSPDNSIRSCDSTELILCGINPINGFRRDENVTAFRSYLVELDLGNIKSQLGTISHLKMPFSAQVFSGNKSIHTVICLNEDLKDEKTYRLIGEWIFNIVTLADRNCINPSRSIRIPGAYREPGKKQRLFQLNQRISHEEFFKWLNKYEHLRPIVKEKKIVPLGEGDYSLLSPWARAMLIKGIDYKDRGRNQTWFSLSYDFCKAGFTEEQTIEILEKRFEPEHDFKEKEWLTAINSGFKNFKD